MTSSTVQVEAPEKSSVPESARLSGLGNRFLELFARRLERPAFGAEVARLVAEAVRVKAVAVLTYHPRFDRLTLVAGEGLSSEIHAVLGGGSECPWDIPLRGLRHRRISVIAAAHQNPFVPRAIANLSPRGLTIVSVPIFHQLQPVGALMLFAVGNRAFSDGALQMLSQALRVCAKGLTEYEFVAEPSPEAREGESSEAVISRLISEGALIDAPDLAALVAQAEPTVRASLGDDVPRVRKLEDELLVAHGEQARSKEAMRSLSAAYGKLARERDLLANELTQFEAAREAALVELRTEIDALEQRVLAVGSERSRYQRRFGSLETERDSLRERVRVSETTAAELQTALMSASAERERLLIDLEALRGRSRSAEDGLERAQAELTAERAALQTEREAGESRLAAARSELEKQVRASASLEADLHASVTARAAAAADLAVARARLQDSDASHEARRQQIADREAARDHAVASAATLQRTLEREQAERGAAERSLSEDIAVERARAERLRADLAQHDEYLAEQARELATRDQQITVLQEAQESARQAEATWQQSTTALRAEVETLRAQVAQGVAEQRQLRADRDALRDESAAAQQRATQAAAVHAEALAHLQAESDALRRQHDELAGERAGLATTLERTAAEFRERGRELAQALQQAAELRAALDQRTADGARDAATRDELAAQAAALSKQLEAAHHQGQRAEKQQARERTTIEFDRDAWKRQVGSLRADVVRHEEALAALRHEHAVALAARDAMELELAAARQEGERQATLAAALQDSTRQLETARAAALGEVEQRQRQLAQERTARSEAERALRADLARVRSETEQATAVATALREEGAAAQAQLTAARTELDSLGRRAAERDGVAEQAAVLANRVAALEHEREVAHAAETEVRQRELAALAALEEVRARAAALTDQHATLEQTVQRRTAEYDRAQSEITALRAALDALGAEAAAQHEQAVLETQQAVGEAEQRVASVQADVETLRTQLQERGTECAQLRAARDDAARQLETVAASRGQEAQTLAGELQKARAQAARLEQVHGATRAALAESQRQAEAALATHQQLRAEVRESQQQLAALQQERTTQRETVHGLRAELETVQAELGEARAAGATLQEQDVVRAAAHKALQERLASLQAESADRGALAQRATDLAQHVARLEAELRVAQRQVAEAGRQQVSVTEAMEVLRDQHAATVREHEEVRAAVAQLRDENQRLEAERAAQDAAQEDLRMVLEELRAQRTQLDEEGRQSTQRITVIQGQLDEMTAVLGARDAALATAAAERQRLTTQVADLTATLRSAQQARDAAEGGAAQTRAATEAERDQWKQSADTARAESERLAATNDELTLTVAQLEQRCGAAATEVSNAQQALEAERAQRTTLRESLKGLQAELRSARAETEHAVADARGARAELSEQAAALGERGAALSGVQQALAEWERRGAAWQGEVEGLRVRLDASSAECAQLRAERAEVERQLGVLAAAHGEEAQALAQGLQAARAQVVQHEEERTTLRAAATAAEQQARQAQEAETAASLANRTEVAALRADVERQHAASGALAERLAEAERQQADHVAQLEAERQRAAAATAAQERMAESIDAARRERTSSDAALAQARAEIVAVQQRIADRDGLAQEASALRQQVGSLQDTLEAVRASQGSAERDRAALAEELDGVRAQQAHGTSAAAREQDSLRAAVERLTVENSRLEAERVVQRGESHAQRATQEELQATLEQLRLERQQLEQEGQDVALRLASAHHQLEEQTEQLRQRDTAASNATAERQRLEEALRLAEAAAAATAAELEVFRGEAEQREVTDETLATDEHEAELARDFLVQVERPESAQYALEAQMMRREERSDVAHDVALVIERSAPLGAVLDDLVEPDVEEVAPESDEATPLGELVLLDPGARGDEAATLLENAGFTVSRAAATEASVDDLATRKVSCVLLNLAGGVGAWQVLKMLRERAGTRSIPVLAYLMLPQAQRGFCFGRTEFGIWPMDAERIIERLKHLKPKLKRLLAVSADVDTTGRIREPLAKAGISTSIVLDGKQALELAGIVSPEAALLHLSGQCPAVARAIAGLRAGESTRELPLLVLLDKAPVREEAFYAGTMRDLVAKPNFSFANLPAELSALLS